jgi:tetratricopeptide (TPR) repeat protein
VRTLLLLVLVVACGGNATTAQSPTKSTGPTDPKAHDYPYELNALIDMVRQSDYSGAATYLSQHLDQCLASKDCHYEAEILYYNWSITYENAGDWQETRKTLQKCLEALPQDPMCTSRLADLESQHNF